MSKLRIMFMGTPDISRICLDALVKHGENVICAVCGEDKPKGRGYVMTPPPVKECATEHGITVYQPRTMRDGSFLEIMEREKPDIAVVVAYGKILPKEILEYPKYGCINVHVSLLPKYRGAAPMQWAIINGDKRTGVTIMRMDEGLDTGDIIAASEFDILDTDNFEDIHDRSAEVGASLLLSVLDDIDRGTATYTKQGEDFTYAKKIEKEDRALSFSWRTCELDCRIRGLSPIPLAYTNLPDGKMLKVVRAEPTSGHGRCGEVIALDDKNGGRGIVVATADGAISLLDIVPEGKGRMSAADFIRGRKIAVGDMLISKI